MILKTHMRIKKEQIDELRKIMKKRPDWKFRRANDIYNEIFNRGLEEIKNAVIGFLTHNLLIDMKSTERFIYFKRISCY